jgi:hypothetical protein
MLPSLPQWTPEQTVLSRRQFTALAPPLRSCALDLRQPATGRKRRATNKTSHQRYVDIFKLLERRDRELADAFNDLVYQTSASKPDMCRRTIRGTPLPQPSLGGLRQHISLYLHALRNTQHKEVHAARLLLHPSASALIQFQLRQDSRTIGRLAPRDSPGVHTRLPRDHGTPAHGAAPT